MVQYDQQERAREMREREKHIPLPSFLQSSTSQQEIETMDSVPDAIIQHTLSQMSNARDLAVCNCVSKRWKDCVPFNPSLYFPRSAFDAAANADAAIGRMVASVVRLEELVIYCPFSAAALASWISLHDRSLRVLELRIDSEPDDPATGETPASQLDCIGAAKRLEVLRLWGVSIPRGPSWGSFETLRAMEIVGAFISDDGLKEMLQCCPNLTDLVLLACDGFSSVSIELQRLERCRLDFVGGENCSLFLSSPMLQVLEVQGFSCVRVSPNHRLKSLCISKNTGRVYIVDFGKLVDLEYLSLRGVQWSWSAISSMLDCTSNVKHLVMKIEFSGDFDTLQPFPEIDLVDFFHNHPKLCSFEIHGAMFAALSHKNSLKSLDSRFTIPCLEEVVITVRSPLNAEQKFSMLESLVRYSVKLRKMIIRISQMKNCHDAADEFFEEICKLKCMNHKIIRIE